MNEPTVTFCCKCDEPKSYRLTLDGGPSGKYHFELCLRCYAMEDKKFVVREEQITISKINGPEGPRLAKPFKRYPLEEVIKDG